MKDHSDRNDTNEEGGRLPFLPSRRWWGTYVAVFSVIMVVYCIILLANPPADYVNQRGTGSVRNLVNDLGAATPVVAFLSYWGTEAIRGMVFFSEKVKESRDRQRERFKAEGIAVGEARKDAEWRAWYAEWKEAQSEGRPFDKLPPGEDEDDR